MSSQKLAPLQARIGYEFKNSKLLEQALTAWTDRSDAGMHYWTKDLVVDPRDPTQSTWYVGVLSGWGGAPNGLGGLYKTTDRGVHWSRILTLDRVESCTISTANAGRRRIRSLKSSKESPALPSRWR